MENMQFSRTGTFGKSARFQVPKNGTSSAQIQQRSPKTSRNTPQNGWVDIWFMRFHFRASIKPILENRIFSIVLAPFYPLNEAKISNQFPVMKTLTEIFQIFCAISVHKKAPKKTQAKVFEKMASWQYALMTRGVKSYLTATIIGPSPCSSSKSSSWGSPETILGRSGVPSQSWSCWKVQEGRK